MGTAFDAQLINGLAGDPAVCVQFTQSGDSVLFDAGSLENLSNRELLKIRVVAISHTHVDHFIGFDRLIRVNIPHFRTLEVVGPTGIIANIKGKLAGYTWNLLEPGQMTFIIHEVRASGFIHSVSLTNSDGFAEKNLKRDLPQDTTLPANIPLQGAYRFTLQATIVDHGTDVLAYCLTLPDTQAVIKERLEELDHSPGPWIGELQRKANQGELTGEININGVSRSASEIARHVLERRQGERLIYVTDMVFSRANLDRVKSLASGPVELLISEANFRALDRLKAKAKSHLTTTQAALLAAAVSAKRLQIFHISNIYASDFQASVLESEAALANYRHLSPEALEAVVSQESSF